MPTRRNEWEKDGKDERKGWNRRKGRNEKEVKYEEGKERRREEMKGREERIEQEKGKGVKKKSWIWVGKEKGERGSGEKRRMAGTGGKGRNQIAFFIHTHYHWSPYSSWTLLRHLSELPIETCDSKGKIENAKKGSTEGKLQSSHWCIWLGRCVLLSYIYLWTLYSLLILMVSEFFWGLKGLARR